MVGQIAQLESEKTQIGTQKARIVQEALQEKRKSLKKLKELGEDLIKSKRFKLAEQIRVENKIGEATELLSNQQGIETALQQLFINLSKRRQECRTPQAARKNLDRVQALETEYLDIEQRLQVLSPSRSRTPERFKSLLDKTKQLIG